MMPRFSFVLSGLPLRAVAVMLISFHSLSCWAQQAQTMQAPVQQLEKIEVTGSNLKRIDAETAAPLQIISRGDIEKSGKQSVSDLIRSLPIDNNGSIGLAFANGLAPGSSAVSLRGLGVNSTLILLNGRRLAPYGLADDNQRNFVDLSAFPLDAVERIEILKDGASAIYGSDAIGGVINIILRKDVQGIVGAVSYGQSRYGDGKEKSARLTGGLGDLASDRYSLTFNLEASHQDAIWQRDRAGRDWIGNGDLRPYGYAIQVGGLSGYFRNSSATVNQSASALGSLVGNVRPATGAVTAYQSLPGCTSTISPAQSAVSSTGDGGCIWDRTQYLQIQPKQDKLSVYLRGVAQLNATTQAYAEFSIANSDVTTSITPQNVAATWADLLRKTVKSTSTISLPAGHPDNPLSGNARLRYTTADVGPRVNEYDTTLSRYLVGLKGSFDAWNFDTGLLYSESTMDRTARGYLKYSVLVQNTTAATPLINPNYRIGDDAGLNTQAFYDQLSPTLKVRAKTSVTSLDFKASRELMQLQGGALELALGAESRHEYLDSPSLPGTESGDVVGLSYAAYKGSRNVNAVFAELSAPVLQSLELSAALRGDRYSDYGNSATPKLGFKWKPLDVVALRGTYSEGFRAPGAAENGNSGAAGVVAVFDPVRNANVNTVVVSASNPDIKPEKSRGYTLGLVLQPVANTSLSIDFWSITRKSEIIPTDASQILLNPSAYPNATVLRDNTTLLNGVPGTGLVLAVSAPYTNANKTVTNGFDLDFKHRVAMGAYGNLNASLNWTYINSFRRKLENGITLEYVGSHGPTVLSGNAGMPRNRGALGLGWDLGPWTVATNFNYISSYSNKESTNGACLVQLANGSDAPAGCRIASFTTTDLYAKWQMRDNIEVTGSIDNLFDRVAPLDPETVVSAINYNPTYHLAGAIGRYFRIGLKYRFK